MGQAAAVNRQGGGRDGRPPLLPDANQAKAATAGANIIVYFGHGNGFPNPYSATEYPDRVNGWGLRDPSRTWNRETCTDSVLRYYGEDYLTGDISGHGWSGGGITPAPDFVMVYSNACYAPGAGEARPAPGQDVAAQRVANYSTPILELGGTYFATDLGSSRIVDLLLRNRSTAFGTLFTMGSGYSETALRRVPHQAFPSRETWVHRTKSQYLGDDYWYAFAGNPGKAPNGSHPGFSSRIGLMPFTDIAGTSWEGAITWVYQHGVMVDGCSQTRFCPTASITRGALAQALADGLRLPATGGDFYADDDGSRFEEGINRLAAAGLAIGCGSGNYCPNVSVRRGALATALAKALQLPPAGDDYFSDDEASPHEESINRVAEAGISRDRLWRRQVLPRRRWCRAGRRPPSCERPSTDVRSSYYSALNHTPVPSRPCQSRAVVRWLSSPWSASSSSVRCSPSRLRIRSSRPRSTPRCSRSMPTSPSSSPAARRQHRCSDGRAGRGDGRGRGRRGHRGPAERPAPRGLRLPAVLDAVERHARESRLRPRLHHRLLLGRGAPRRNAATHATDRLGGVDTPPR